MRNDLLRDAAQRPAFETGVAMAAHLDQIAGVHLRGVFPLREKVTGQFGDLHQDDGASSSACNARSDGDCPLGSFRTIEWHQNPLKHLLVLLSTSLSISTATLYAFWNKHIPVCSQSHHRTEKPSHNLVTVASLVKKESCSLCRPHIVLQL